MTFGFTKEIFNGNIPKDIIKYIFLYYNPNHPKILQKINDLKNHINHLNDNLCNQTKILSLKHYQNIDGKNDIQKKMKLLKLEINGFLIELKQSNFKQFILCC